MYICNLVSRNVQFSPTIHLDPVVQSIVSLTSSLRGQLVKCLMEFLTKYTDIFVQKNERSFCTAKASHFFFNKNIGIFEMLTFEILTSR